MNDQNLLHQTMLHTNARNLHLNSAQRSFFRPTEAANRIRADQLVLEPSRALLFAASCCPVPLRMNSSPAVASRDLRNAAHNFGRR